ncbi:BHH_G0025530.mRNA.1.CDS.1 [Saccharomyces cerevisiae]|nr:BHH_G0025530.mRNA.1.CDS.1 [Saccharomyces cerevisiae]CAI7163480.1 BHH_G0025530.mRNA.1.CDS.1 [Saccharomyces cerevisiae]
MFNRFNKFQAAVALALLSRGALGDSYTNSTSSADLSSITSVSSASASATASDSLSSSDGTVYLPSTTISGDLTVTGKVIATEAVEVAAGGKLTLLDGEKYVFSSDLKVHGDLVVEKSEASYEGTAFDVSGETFEVSGNFSAEETGAVSASIYSFTPSSFKSSGDISLSLSKAKKGEVTFSPYSNAGTFSLSNAILNGGSVSGLQRRDDDEGSVNNGEINLDNGSTYVIVEPVSGNGTINIVSGNLYLHYPDTFTGQTVVFKGEGVVAVDPTETNATPIPVVGYTGKNQIAITADITALSYDGTTGVLTATQGNRQFSFEIGTGFSSSGFSVSEGIFAGAYSYYLNYDGVIATSAASTSASTTSGVVSTATGSVTLSSNASTTVSSTISSSAPDSIIPSSSASISGVSNSTTASGSIASTASTASTTSTASAASATSFTSGSASVYTTTLTYLNATSTVVVSCSETTDASGNIYTITTTVPCSSTTATITSVTKTDAMFQHQLLPTQLQPFPPASHTPLLLLLTVTTMAVTPRLSLLNVLKKLQQPPFLQNHTLLLPLLTVTTTAVTPRLSLPRLPNKHHWPLAQSPSLLLQLLILLLPAPSLVLSFNPKVWLLV